MFLKKCTEYGFWEKAHYRMFRFVDLQFLFAESQKLNVESLDFIKGRDIIIRDIIIMELI